MIPVVCAGAIRVLLMVMPIPCGAEPTPHVGVTVVHEALQSSLSRLTMSDSSLLHRCARFTAERKVSFRRRG